MKSLRDEISLYTRSSIGLFNTVQFVFYKIISGCCIELNPTQIEKVTMACQRCS